MQFHISQMTVLPTPDLVKPRLQMTLLHQILQHPSQNILLPRVTALSIVWVFSIMSLSYPFLYKIANTQGSGINITVPKFRPLPAPINLNMQSNPGRPSAVSTAAPARNAPAKRQAYNMPAQKDWRANAMAMIDKYEGRPKGGNVLYQDTADSARTNPNRYLTAPGGVLMDPSMQRRARQLGYTGRFVSGAAFPERIWKQLRQERANQYFDRMERVPGFKTLRPDIKAILGDAQYNTGSAVGSWPNLTKAIAANDYEGIARELKDSKVWRDEQARIAEKPYAQRRWTSHVENAARIAEGLR